MKPDKNINLNPLPILPWTGINWEKVPVLPWPHKMINLAESWSKFYPCKQCGFCCQRPPLIKILKNKAYYLPSNEKGYCVMYDDEKKLCKIHKERPLECRLLVCKAPSSVKDRLAQLLIKFLEEYTSEVEKYSTPEYKPDEITKNVFDK